MKYAGVSLLGIEKDIVSDASQAAFMSFRPTVALALQRTYPLECLFLLYEKKSSVLLMEITDAIKGYIECPKIVPVPIEFTDPYDFDDCFSALHTALDQIRKKTPLELLVSVNTGTHTMRFSFVLIAEKGLLDGIRLAHVAPGSVTDLRQNHTSQAEIRLLDNSLQASSTFSNKLKRARAASQRAIVPVCSKSGTFRKQIELLNQIGSETDDPILILGETGTGKTVIVEKIHTEWARRHSTSSRHSSKLICLNCAGYSADTAYSRLFGHVRGSFTGAERDVEGAIADADGGTLFLDEIGDLDLVSQAMLLTTLETGRYSRHGETVTRTSNFRLICATNKNLQSEFSEGRFRHDLLARISMWVFTLPSLRERIEDIPDNVDFELIKWNEKAIERGASVVHFEKSVRSAYLEFACSPDAQWSDNFRDLGKSIGRMATHASIKAHRNVGVITTAIVEEECNRLVDAWRALACTSSPNEHHSVLSAIEMLATKNHPTMSMIDAVELMLQEELLERTGNKANASRILYGPKSNSTAFLTSRQRRLANRE